MKFKDVKTEIIEEEWNPPYSVLSFGVYSVRFGESGSATPGRLSICICPFCAGMADTLVYHNANTDILPR